MVIMEVAEGFSFHRLEAVQECHSIEPVFFCSGLIYQTIAVCLPLAGQAGQGQADPYGLP